MVSPDHFAETEMPGESLFGDVISHQLIYDLPFAVPFRY